MAYGDLHIFDMAVKKLFWLSQRQDVLARNIANADTPDFRPRDLKQLNFRKTLSQQFWRMNMRPSSQGASMAGTLPTDPKFRDPKQRRVYETSPAGNAVVLEEQLFKAQQTALQHRTTSQLYKKYASMIRLSLRGRGR